MSAKLKGVLMAAGAALIGPFQLTIAELQDKFDESKTTAFQPDLIIGAWGSWVVVVIMLMAGSKAAADAKEAKDLAKTLSEKMP